MNIFFRIVLGFLIILSQLIEGKKNKINLNRRIQKKHLIKRKKEGKSKPKNSHAKQAAQSIIQDSEHQDYLEYKGKKFENLSIDEKLETISNDAINELKLQWKNKYDDLPEKKIVIVTPSYKNAQWYTYNLMSIFKQNYSNYRVIYIDDLSPDNTANLVENFIKENHQNHRVKLIKNQTRNLALKNLYNAIASCDDDEIIAILDGDDMLAHNDVLAYLNRVYFNPNVWMTYGNCRFLSTGETCSWAMPIPEDIIKKNNFREWPHGQTHLRTFYAGLFKKVNVDDLKYEGEFFRMTYDVAMLIPMIEMAGERHLFIKDVLYVYNDMNIINDHKVDKGLQTFLNTYIRQKAKYTRIIHR